MFDTIVREISAEGKNTVKAKVIELDEQLSCVVNLSAKDSSIGELLFGNILDKIIDNIHPKNVYKDFQNALEHINAFIQTLSPKNEKIQSLHALIGIKHKNSFYFSTIGKASCYLININLEVIEVTDKSERPELFSHILNGDISSGEALLIGSNRLLNVFSKDDIANAIGGAQNSKTVINILEHIYSHENVYKNLSISFLRDSEEFQQNSKVADIYEIVSYRFMKVLDNSFTKKILSQFYILRDKILEKNVETQKYIYGFGLVVSLLALYMIISQFVAFTSNTSNVAELENNLLTAQNYVVSASENMNNEDMFSFNINSANTIISDLREQEMFLSDLEKLQGEIQLLQKQFNGIEPFIANTSNTLYTFENTENIVQVVQMNSRVYIVTSREIFGPISANEEVSRYQFEDLPSDDMFVDAVGYNSDIVLTTNSGRVVNFTSNNFFSFVDVSGQETWDIASNISSYAQNIYVLSRDRSQIVMHRKSGNAFTQGTSYLTQNDSDAIGEIYSIAVDGGIYILKNDGSVVKLFRSPQYRLESLSLNGLPENYDFDTIAEGTLPSIKANIDLRYVYMLYNNKIIIFEPNSRRFQDTKSLTYIGQIEATDNEIMAFYPRNDGEIVIATSAGVYKIEYDVVDENLIIKQ